MMVPPVMGQLSSIEVEGGGKGLVRPASGWGFGPLTCCEGALRGFSPPPLCLQSARAISCEPPPRFIHHPPPSMMIPHPSSPSNSPPFKIG